MEEKGEPGADPAVFERYPRRVALALGRAGRGAAERARVVAADARRSVAIGVAGRGPAGC